MTFEMLLDVPEVFEVRAGNDRFAEDGRFQNVMAPPLGDFPAHKNHVCVLEKTAQLADRIEQQHVCPEIRHFAAACPTQSGSLQLAYGFLKPLRLPWGHDQTPAAEGLLGCNHEILLG